MCTITAPTGISQRLNWTLTAGVDTDDPAAMLRYHILFFRAHFLQLDYRGLSRCLRQSACAIRRTCPQRTRSRAHLDRQSVQSRLLSSWLENCFPGMRTELTSSDAQRVAWQEYAEL
jgi:hypothetical protein